MVNPLLVQAGLQAASSFLPNNSGSGSGGTGSGFPFGGGGGSGGVLPGLSSSSSATSSAPLTVTAPTINVPAPEHRGFDFKSMLYVSSGLFALIILTKGGK